MPVPRAPPDLALQTWHQYQVANASFGGASVIRRVAPLRTPVMRRAPAVDDAQPATTNLENEAWRRLLIDGQMPVRLSHRIFRHVPGDPRCKLCHNPFGGIAGRAMKVIGCQPSRVNPSFCTRCAERLPQGGAKVDAAVLFADIRGSTGLGEHAHPDEYADLLNRFYRTATHVLVSHDAIIDKIIGDEVMALFVQGFAGRDYRRKAAEAAMELVASLNCGMRLPVGAAVNAGTSFVGSVGSEYVVDFTAVGDTVNTAARMQGYAEAGQVVLADAVYGEIEHRWPHAERRRLEIRGREAPVDASIVTV
jgi:adenylate cyclase